MWINSLCKLCLIYSRTKDLINLRRDDKIPELLNYLANVIKFESSRTLAFANSFNFVKNLVGNPDPYVHTKKNLNIIGLKLAKFAEKYLEENSWDLRKALKLSAAANIVDTTVLGYEDKDFEGALTDEPVIDEVVAIPNDLEVYVVLDNVGEAFIDMLLVKALKLHGYKVHVVVRKESYEIDVLKDDLIGIASYVDVVETPGNISPVYYIDRGFIIAKGIANAEAYLEVGKTSSIHLLRAKCDVIAKIFRVPKNSPLIISGETLKRTFSNSTKLNSF